MSCDDYDYDDPACEERELEELILLKEDVEEGRVDYSKLSVEEQLALDWLWKQEEEI